MKNIDPVPCYLDPIGGRQGPTGARAFNKLALVSAPRTGDRDLVRCGPGRDSAEVDRKDRVKGWEKVERA